MFVTPLVAAALRLAAPLLKVAREAPAEQLTSVEAPLPPGQLRPLVRD